MPHNLHLSPPHVSLMALHNHLNLPLQKVSGRSRTNSTKAGSNTTTNPPAAKAKSTKYTKYSKYTPKYESSLPSYAFLRDILSLVFILLALPNTISLGLLVIHIILGSDDFKGYKFFIHYVLFNDHQFTSWKDTVSISSIMRIAIIDVTIFGVLWFFVPQRAYFNYLVIFSKTLISLDLIGSSTSNSATSKQFHSVVCFLIVNYINYSIHWFNSYYNMNAYYEKIMFINGMNFHLNKLYLLLSVHVIVSSWIRMSNATGLTSSNISSASVNCDVTKLLNIYLDESLEKKAYEKSIAIHNFENFITQNVVFKKSLIQPFWSLIAASKAIIQKPSLFRGDAILSSAILNSNEFSSLPGQYARRPLASLTSAPAEIPQTNLTLSNTVNYYNPHKMSIMLIDDSRILIRFLNKLQHTSLRVTLNQINWSYFKIVDGEYLLIYGLTPLFQYEIDLIADSKVVSHFIINTTNTKDTTQENVTRVLNKSIETSTLKTLQISLVSKINTLAVLRARNKKFKKDEHKKQLELTKGIESLRSKISRYESDITTHSTGDGDNRAVGKLKGLKHTVIQLESEIETLNTQIEQSSLQHEQVKEEFAQAEAVKSADIARLEEVYLEYKNRLARDQDRVKVVKAELANLTLKNTKLSSRNALKEEEIEALHANLKALKKEVSVKLNKKTRRLNENFSVILPAVSQETETLSEGYY